jgi:hypothetical protein
METEGMKKRKTLELFVDRGTTIIDHDGNHLTIAEARSLWEAGKVSNYNLSFHRLATRANWDFDELARQYRVEDAIRGLLKD